MTRISRTGGNGVPVSSVSNSDGTITISPTTGAVVASLALAHANTWTATQTFQTILPSADVSYNIGSSAANWNNVWLKNQLQINGGTINVFNLAGDFQPSIQIAANYIKFGAGGASAPSSSFYLNQGTVVGTSPMFQPVAGNTNNILSLAPKGTATFNLLMIYRTGDVLTNPEWLEINSDDTAAGSFGLWVRQAGTGSLRPLIFQMGATEAFRITTDPYFQYAIVATGAGSAALGANCPAATVTAPYTWFKMKSSDGSIVYIPAWK